jgi:hypothetical protein
MNSSPGLRKIEIALIELEYAAADFCHWKSSTTGPGDLAALISKLMETNQALDLCSSVHAAR